GTRWSATRAPREGPQEGSAAPASACPSLPCAASSSATQDCPCDPSTKPQVTQFWPSSQSPWSVQGALQTLSVQRWPLGQSASRQFSELEHAGGAPTTEASRSAPSRTR